MNSTNLTVVIAHHRPEDDELLVDLLDEHGCEASYHGNAIVTGLAYGAEDVSLSAADDLAEALIKAAPFTSFEAYTDPADDMAGQLVRYAPIRGRVDSECGFEGGEGDMFEWIALG